MGHEDKRRCGQVNHSTNKYSNVEVQHFVADHHGHKVIINDWIWRLSEGQKISKKQDIQVWVWRGWVPGFLRRLYSQVQNRSIFQRMRPWLMEIKRTFRNAYPVRVDHHDTEGQDVDGDGVVTFEVKCSDGGRNKTE